MKKGKAFLTGTLAIVILGGAFAFKTAHTRFDNSNIYQFDGSNFIKTTDCYYPATDECTTVDNTLGTYYYYDIQAQTYDQLPKTADVQLFLPTE